MSDRTERRKIAREATEKMRRILQKVTEQEEELSLYRTLEEALNRDEEWSSAEKPGPTEQKSLNEELADWATDENISLKALTGLLKILRRYGQLLPADARTMLNTPRVNDPRVTYIPAAGGKWEVAHLGVLEGIKEAVSLGEAIAVNGKVKITSFVDGFSPMAKNKFISIQHRVYRPGGGNKYVFISGLASGKGKVDMAEVLRPLVDEMYELITKPFCINGIEYLLEPGGPMIMDIPARAECLAIKQSGWFSCHKCTIEGESFMVVVFNRFEYDLRTDERFRNNEYPETQKGQSEFCRILGIDMVRDFICEPMHLLYLGITRRLFVEVLQGDERLPPALRAVADSRWFEALAKKPHEFKWVAEALTKCHVFKAKELRYLLLYSGIVIMRSLVDPDTYKLLCGLSVGARILTDRRLAYQEEWVSCAEDLLYNFAIGAKAKFLDTFMGKNVHLLQHLVLDVRRYGPLEDFSAFPYEHMHGRLGRKLHGPKRPLRQLVHRYLESGRRVNARTTSTTQKPSAGRASQVVHGGSLLRPDGKNDLVMLKDGTYLQVEEIYVQEHTVLQGRRYTSATDLFLEPVHSTLVGIAVLEGLSALSEQFWVEDVHRKCVRLQDGSRLVAAPMLHDE